ncbi:MAG: two-component regulator propeller domain-containing protein [Bacteroidales bacterium]|nr:two-component regulator propeller domain-containing protein [Bacteroidales bacterium]
MMMTRRILRMYRVVAMTLLCMCVVPLSAQVVRTQATQKLMPVANVHCILQDSEGYMWYGTYGGGLCRDNGYQIDVFRADARYPAIRHNNVQRIVEDTRGDIWFGTSDGLYVLDKRSNQVTEKGRVPGRYMALMRDRKGQMWVGAPDGVVCYAKDGTTVVAEDHQVKESAQFIYEDREGGIWVVYLDAKLWKWNTNKKKLVQQPWDNQYLPKRMVESAVEGHYWVGTWERGVVDYDAASGMVTPQPDTTTDFDHGCVLDMLMDSRRGVLWVTSMNRLSVYNCVGTELRPLDLSHLLGTEFQILDGLAEDRDGNIWVSGFSPHTFIITMEDFDMVRYGIPQMTTLTGYRVLADRGLIDGDNLWLMQARKGLMLYNTKNNVLKVASSVYNTQMEKVADSDGIWFADWATLHRFTAPGDVVTDEVEHDFGSAIYSLCNGVRGRLYVGTAKGLMEYVPRQKTHKVLCETKAAVDCIAADRDVVYFKVLGDDIYVLEHDAPPRKVSDGVGETFTGLALSPDGTLWASTAQGSVYVLKAGQKRLERDDLMSDPDDNNIIDIASDRAGHVWVMTEHLVREFNPTTHSFRTIRNSDPQVQVSMFRRLDPQDDMRMGLDAYDAFCVFEASADIDRQSEGDTGPVVTGYVVRDSLLMMSGQTEIEVAGDVNSLILQCSTFDHLNTQNVTFAYRIDDLGGEWIYLPQGVNTIYLNNLPKGRHHLLLRATDGNGAWMNTISDYTIDRRPLWWETWWARVIFVLLTLALLYGIWRLNRRIRFLLSLQRLHKDFVLNEVQIRPDADENAADIDDDFLRRAIQSVERHLSDPDYGVDQFCSDMCLSRTSLYRKLYPPTGQTPKEFIRDIRLKKAAKTLRKHPNMPVNQLAENVGFSSSSYFAKCFKDKFGVLPTQFVGKDQEVPK